MMNEILSRNLNTIHRVFKMKVLETREEHIRQETSSEVIKGVWGMPWLLEAMKDVISCEKLRGLAHTR